MRLTTTILHRSGGSPPSYTLSRREFDMNRRFPVLVFMAALGPVVLHAQAQPQGQTPRPNADPYINNPDAGKTQFPLAAPAGQDSGAITKAPAGAVNQGTIDLAKWKYGPAFDAPPNSKIWNPVMIKMMKGEKVTGGTVFSTDSPETYCAMANAGYDFIRPHIHHDPRDSRPVAPTRNARPHAN